MFTTTTTTTTTIAGPTPIMSTGVGTASDLYGIGHARHHLSAVELPHGGVNEIMLRLKFEVKFAKVELAEEFDNTLADLEDEAHSDATRKRKKAAVMLHMMGEEKKRDAFEHTLTYLNIYLWYC